VARDAACKFLRIGVRASVFDDGSMMLMSASLLQKGDVVVAFSYSGQTLIVLEAVRQAQKNGAHIIAITNSPGSRLTQVGPRGPLCHGRRLATDWGERGSPLGPIESFGRLVHGRSAKQPHGN